MEVLLIAFVVLGVFGGITGVVAQARGHGFWPFFFLGALISPVLGIILTFIISPPRRRGSSSRRRPVRRTGAGSATRRQVRRAPPKAPSANPYEAPARW